MAQQRLAAFASSVEEILNQLSIQERNAFFHDLYEVKAKYTKKINTKRPSSDIRLACNTKRQATLFTSVVSTRSSASGSATSKEHAGHGQILEDEPVAVGQENVQAQKESCMQKEKKHYIAEQQAPQHDVPDNDSKQEAYLPQQVLSFPIFP